jgi:hypothetical protein
MDIVLDDGHDADGQPLEQPAEVEEPVGNLFSAAKPEKDEKDKSPKQKRLF